MLTTLRYVVIPAMLLAISFPLTMKAALGPAFCQPNWLMGMAAPGLMSREAKVGSVTG